MRPPGWRTRWRRWPSGCSRDSRLRRHRSKESRMPETAPVRGREAWTSWPGRLAVVLLLAQACWRGYYLLRGYYVQDDFRMLKLGGSNGLTIDYLFQEYSGHMWPGDFLIAWATARVDPISWTIT